MKNTQVHLYTQKNTFNKGDGEHWALGYSCSYFSLRPQYLQNFLSGLSDISRVRNTEPPDSFYARSTYATGTE